MRTLYKTFTHLYSAGVSVASNFNAKANQLKEGRAESLDVLRSLNLEADVIWFHCASLGEFEQGKPVMERFKQNNPHWKLVVTFFSPSGYQLKHDYPLADHVLYLPRESEANVALFLERIQPKIAVFVKYEFWYDYMQGLSNAKIPLVFISSTFRKNQLFFQWYGKWFLRKLKNVNHFFVQDLESEKLLNSFGIEQVITAGDTRFDRVYDTFLNNEKLAFLDLFKDKRPVLIFGSAWQKETEVFLEVIKKLPIEWKVIYAPHEIYEDALLNIQNKISISSVLYSELNEANAKDSQVLIVNTIGHLARMYKYSDVAIVGGGFTDGIHNILEPLVFGCPVFFGPNHLKFWEGQKAIDRGIGFEFTDFNTLELNLDILLCNEGKRKQTRLDCHQFIDEGRGATEKIERYLSDLNL